MSFQKKSHPKSITEARTELGEAPVQGEGRMPNKHMGRRTHRRGIGYFLRAVVALPGARKLLVNRVGLKKAAEHLDSRGRISCVVIVGVREYLNFAFADLPQNFRPFG